MLWAVVYGATVTCVACGLALALLPSRLFVASDRIVPNDAAPPPWRSLNRLGVLLYVLFVGSAALLLVAALAGMVMEGQGG